MPNYKTNLWTGTVAGQHGLHLSGVFPQLDAITNEISFNSSDMDSFADGGLHALTNAAEGRDDCRRFLWAVLEQFYVAYTGGANSSIVNRNSASVQAADVQDSAIGSGEGKTTKMTVSKSSLSLIDEDTAKTTYTVVFNYAVGLPGGGTLEVEDE